MRESALLQRCKRIVIKVGTSQVTEKGIISPQKIQTLTKIITQLQKSKEIVLVSSGAISAGITEAGLQVKKSLSIPYKQAAAAIGQTAIMQVYREAFAKHNIIAGQVLLTNDVMQNRERYLNASNTLATLLKIGAIPIVNENDTMVVDEIKVGDNDQLASMVSQLCDAQLLILLSDVDGFYKNFHNPDERELLSQIESIDDSIHAMAHTTGNDFATGGMITKLKAAEMNMATGIHTILANGQDPAILFDILEGKNIGTLFKAEKPTVSGKKFWLKQHLAKKGVLRVDQGAQEAIIENGTSLLPKGIIEVNGNFNSGDGVSVIGPDGKEFAIGITNYGREELVQIIGKNSNQIETILGYKSYDVVLHRDNMVVEKATS